jgi:hypothetical protein
MRCNEIQQLLPDWIHDREHSPQCREIAQHLDSCAHCRLEAEQFEQVLIMIHNDTPFIPSQAYFATLLPHIHERIASRQKKKKILRVFSLATPIVAIAMLLVVFGHWFQKPQYTMEIDFRSALSDLNAQELQSLLATNDFISLEEFSAHASEIFNDVDREVVLTIVSEHNVSLAEIQQIVPEEIISLETLSDEQAEQLPAILEKKF